MTMAIDSNSDGNRRQSTAIDGNVLPKKTDKVSIKNHLKLLWQVDNASGKLLMKPRHLNFVESPAIIAHNVYAS